ncbi:MAG: FRG domain-containing protein [Bacteroidetes bacterium]|nr:FRG domain-containing protein [Bacteroidota bacterium]
MKIREIRIETWQEFIKIMTGSKFKSWAFRGQSDARWPVQSTLSRYFKSFNVHPEAWPQQESRILRIFKRKAHLFLSRVPNEADSFQWLALMQHHGTPTRLIDFTWSPYVAAFFALERATEDAAIWAVFPPGLSNVKIRTIRASQKVEADELGPWVPGNYEQFFLPNENDLVVIGEPHYMNQRLVAQSGTFIMPGKLEFPIEQIVSNKVIVKFVLSTSNFRRQAMAELYNMNINNSTLFPGLDGLAKSLAYELEFHWAFNPITMEQNDGFFVD